MIDRAKIEDALRQIEDPELGCNLVDLGLIYSTEVAADQVRVTMTLTTPGCPMHDSLVAGVQAALEAVEGVSRAEVEVVWDPPWDPSMMTPAGRALVGMA